MTFPALFLSAGWFWFLIRWFKLPHPFLVPSPCPSVPVSAGQAGGTVALPSGPGAGLGDDRYLLNQGIHGLHHRSPAGVCLGGTQRFPVSELGLTATGNEASTALGPSELLALCFAGPSRPAKPFAEHTGAGWVPPPCEQVGFVLYTPLGCSQNLHLPLCCAAVAAGCAPLRLSQTSHQVWLPEWALEPGLAPFCVHHRSGWFCGSSSSSHEEINPSSPQQPGRATASAETRAADGVSLGLLVRARRGLETGAGRENYLLGLPTRLLSLVRGFAAVPRGAGREQMQTEVSH